MFPNHRLDRQLRIPGWDQKVLSQAKIGVVGDYDLLASLYLLAAAALGLNQIIVLAPHLDARFLQAARRLNPENHFLFLEGYYAHPHLEVFFQDCQLLVDLSRYGLANKLALNHGFQNHLPVIRGFCYEEDGQEGFQVFTYKPGREWQDLEQLITPLNFPGKHFDDGVLDIIVAGFALEETKNLLMGQQVSEEIIGIQREALPPIPLDLPILVVGAGALGNFVGLGLAFAGFHNLTFMDPDVVEVTNLNRQVLFFDSVGAPKAAALAARLKEWFGINAQARVEYFRPGTEVDSYEAVFDCVDNFATRLALSRTCEASDTILISGGTGVSAGQVMVFDPSQGGFSPAQTLGLEEILARRPPDPYERQRDPCLYQPDPSIIMTNQIIAGFMVETFRQLLAGQKPENLFYDATSNKKF